MKTSRLLRVLVSVLILVWVWLFFLQKINLHNSDIGRHIMNGKLVLSQGFDVIRYNTYSYTNPDFPVITHHWLSGVIFYGVLSVSGWYGLSILYALINTGAVGLLLATAKKNLDFWVRAAVVMLLVPLFAIRYEIRPEGFSYLLMAVFYVMLQLYREKRLAFKWLWLLVPLMMLWVNLHIFFVFGLGLTVFYFGEELIRFKKLPGKIWGLLVSLGLATLFNPFGLWGAVAPLTIFKEFGYELAENQTVFFLQKRFGHPYYVHFELVVLGLLLMFAMAVPYRKKIQNLAGYLFSLVLMLLAFNMARMMSLFSLFLIPVFADLGLFIFQQRKPKLDDNIVYLISLCSSLLLILVGLVLSGVYFSPFRQNYGLGLLPRSEKAFTFFREKQIQGPIFNNYDNGGYLIYGLYPDYPVFVDNRPEAYPVTFFKDIYIPMQQQASIWDIFDAQYGFNAIFFYWHDMTPWGQTFIIRAVHDAEWTPIYLDDYSLILVRNAAQNQELIEKYALPEEIFGVTSPSE